MKFTIKYARYYEFAVDAPTIAAAAKFGAEYEKQFGDNVKVLSILAEGRAQNDTSPSYAKVETAPLLTLSDLPPSTA